VRRAVSSPRVRPGATARPAVAAALLHGARHPRQRHAAYTYATPASAQRSVRAELDAGEQAGLDLRRDTAAELPFPVLDAIRLDEQAQLDPMDVLLAVATDLQQHGGEIFEQTRVRRCSPARSPLRSPSTVTSRPSTWCWPRGCRSRTGRGISPGWSPELRDTITTAYTAPMAHAGAMIKYARTPEQRRARARSRATSSAHQRRHRFRDAARPQRSTTATLNGPRAR